MNPPWTARSLHPAEPSETARIHHQNLRHNSGLLRKIQLQTPTVHLHQSTLKRSPLSRHRLSYFKLGPGKINLPRTELFSVSGNRNRLVTSTVLNSPGNGKTTIIRISSSHRIFLDIHNSSFSIMAEKRL